MKGGAVKQYSKVQEGNIHPISWLDIFVTEACNMKCSYCFHKQRPTDMTDDVMESMLSFMKDKLEDFTMFNFFGGEPLLRPDFCIKWMKRLRQEMPKCGLYISTNGTIYCPDIQDIMLSDNSTFQISYDGLDQDRYRGNSSLVEENIKKYVSILPPWKLNVRMTYTRDTISNITRNIERIFSLGIRKIIHQAELTDKWTEEDFELYGKELDKIYKFIDLNPSARIQFCNCDRVNNLKENVRCGVGKSLLSITPNGDIYPCHRLVKFDNLKLGNVLDRTLDRGRFLTLDMDCDDCFSKNTCHPCMAAFYEYTGSLVEKLEATCGTSKQEHIKAQEAYNISSTYVKDNKNLIRSMISVLEDMKSSKEELIRSLIGRE